MVSKGQYRDNYCDTIFRYGSFLKPRDDKAYCSTMIIPVYHPALGTHIVETIMCQHYIKIYMY